MCQRGPGKLQSKASHQQQQQQPPLPLKSSPLTEICIWGRDQRGLITLSLHLLRLASDFWLPPKRTLGIRPEPTFNCILCRTHKQDSQSESRRHTIFIDSPPQAMWALCVPFQHFYSLLWPAWHFNLLQICERNWNWNGNAKANTHPHCESSTSYVYIHPAEPGWAKSIHDFEPISGAKTHAASSKFGIRPKESLPPYNFLLLNGL